MIQIEIADATNVVLRPENPSERERERERAKKTLRVMWMTRMSNF
jgi:hypothetical protein